MAAFIGGLMRRGNRGCFSNKTNCALQIIVNAQISRIFIFFKMNLYIMT